MNLRDFIVYTFVGAFIWNVILAVIGYYLYEMREQIFPYMEYILYLLGIIFIIYLVISVRNNKRKKNISES